MEEGPAPSQGHMALGNPASGAPGGVLDPAASLRAATATTSWPSSWRTACAKSAAILPALVMAQRKGTIRVLRCFRASAVQREGALRLKSKVPRPEKSTPALQKE